MNEQIKQLVEQADLGWAVRRATLQGDNTDLKSLNKFAELIIKECAGIIEEYGLSLIGSDENYLGETLNLSIKVQEAGDKIKQHFGVDHE